MSRIKKIALLFFCIVVVGCSTTTPSQKTLELLQGAPITSNRTPYTSALECAAIRVADNADSFSRKPRIAVGEIPDRSGKVNPSEGAKVTQGVEYMAITALNEFSEAIQIVERMNLAAYSFEANLTKSKLIGDDKNYRLSSGETLNYRPLLTGSVQGADYFITGAITEVNYNIYSGGSLLGISGISIGKRTVAMNVAIDMRIVNMRNLKVVDSISLEKQFIGERSMTGIYRFFDKELLAYDGGSSRDEPIQKGVRSLVERGVSALVSKVMRVKTDSCFEKTNV